MIYEKLPKSGLVIYRDFRVANEKGRGNVEIYLFDDETRTNARVILREVKDERSAGLRIEAKGYTVLRGEVVRKNLNYEELGDVFKGKPISEEKLKELKLIERDRKRDLNWNTKDLPSKVMVSHNGVDFSKKSRRNGVKLDWNSLDFENKINISHNGEDLSKYRNGFGEL